MIEKALLRPEKTKMIARKVCSIFTRDEENIQVAKCNNRSSKVYAIEREKYSYHIGQWENDIVYVRGITLDY